MSAKQYGIVSSMSKYADAYFSPGWPTLRGANRIAREKVAHRPEIVQTSAPGEPFCAESEEKDAFGNPVYFVHVVELVNWREGVGMA